MVSTGKKKEEEEKHGRGFKRPLGRRNVHDDDECFPGRWREIRCVEIWRRRVSGVSTGQCCRPIRPPSRDRRARRDGRKSRRDGVTGRWRRQNWRDAERPRCNRPPRGRRQICTCSVCRELWLEYRLHSNTWEHHETKAWISIRPSKPIKYQHIR